MATLKQCDNRTMSISVGDTVELEIARIAHGGVCIAFYDKRTIFVSDTLPGETVRAEIVDVKKRIAHAETVEVLHASPDRVPHIWSEASVDRAPSERAGGAEFGHIALAAQRDLKFEVLRDAMRRQGKLEGSFIDETVIEPLPGDDEFNGLGWRTRMRLHVDPVSGAVGPYAARTHTVVPVTSLPLMVDTLQPLAPLDQPMPDATRVDLVAPSADDPRMLVTYRGEKRPTGAEDTVRELVGDFTFQVHAGGFWQVHREAPAALAENVAAAVDWLGERVDPAATNLDLYGGVGLLTAGFLSGAGDAARITTVESSEGATDLAAENLSAFPGVQPVTARVEHYVRDLLQGSSAVRERLNRGTVVLDPPRAGAGLEVTEALIELAPANIVYVACDPVALARDTAVLVAGGYELTALRGFDLFPHTHHFESIAVFQRN
jgi:tRNA/tmRNA/rRNA uracil-C5-methylase (TrmA/RlmC/RlmD family)